MTADLHVSSVAEFIDCILREHRSGPSLRATEVSCLNFYRGQANADWKLSPRLFRENLLGQERALIEEIMRIDPASFQGMDYFDQLVKMQHYGLPTRLLDTTLNPLVALYFACYEKEQIGKNGIVWVFPRLPVFTPRHRYVLVSMIYSFEISGEAVDFKRAAELVRSIPRNQYTWDATPEGLLRSCVIGWPNCAVLPNLNNRRVQNQEGSFLICNLQERHSRNSSGSSNLTFVEARDVHADLIDWSGTFSVIIPSGRKLHILDELALLGIHRGRLFPELEHQTENIIRGVRGSGGSAS